MAANSLPSASANLSISRQYGSALPSAHSQQKSLRS